MKKGTFSISVLATVAALSAPAFAKDHSASDHGAMADMQAAMAQMEETIAETTAAMNAAMANVKAAYAAIDAMRAEMDEDGVKPADHSAHHVMTDEDMTAEIADMDHGDKAEMAEPQTYEIDMLNRADHGRMVFGDEVLFVNVGDTITFKPTDRGHNAESWALPEGEDGFRGRIGAEVSFTPSVPGVTLVKCTPHVSAGMFMIVVAGDDLSNIEDISDVRVRGRAADKLENLIEAAKAEAEERAGG